MLISYNFIKKYGYLSNEYFLYSEDTEYCMRAIVEGGYKMLCVPKVLIYHKVNASTGTGSKMQQYYLVRWALSLYEVIRYHYDFSVICRAFRDYKNGVTGKVDYFE